MENELLKTNKPLEIWGHSIRWYIDEAEKPSLILAGIVLAIYVITFWIEMSYLGWLSPSLMFILIGGSIVYTYFFIVKKNLGWREGFIICGAMGFVFGLASAVLALVRFWYGWLVINLAFEPFISALLAAGVSFVTWYFFKLPPLIKHNQSNE